MNGERGWDPKVKQYFLKIIRSFSWGLLWMMSGVAAGIYYELGYPDHKPFYQTIVFYVFMLVTGFFLVRYLLRIWKDGQ